nr:putative ribonuclease H-like domain-containing protein [Tanacetum cinerariifolium]
MSKKSYCLVVIDDYSRFTWVFFLATKDETSPILKTFITGLENQLSLKVKVIRSDNGTEFKNNDLNQFCRMNGIKKEFSVPRTSQQNGISKRKNRTLIEAARTILVDSLLPIPFWAEAVNTACKFEEKVDEGFLVGYSVSSKAFGVFNSRTCIVQETLHVNFLENKPTIAGSGPTWLFDVDSLTKTMNYQPVTAGNQFNHSAGFQDKFTTEKTGEEGPEFDANKPESKVNVSPSSNAQSKKQDDKTKRESKGKIPTVGQISSNSTKAFSAAGNTFSATGNTFSAVGPLNAAASSTHGKSSFIDASQLLDDPDMPELEDITYSDDEDDVGTEADFNNLETSITVSPIPTTRVHKDHHVTQIIGKFQMSLIGELTFFLGLQVKQKKDGIFISQDKYVAEILRKFRLTEGKSASTPIDIKKPLLKDPDGEDVDVHTYRLSSWQCKKQTVVATSFTKAKYVVAASCYAQVLWIQNQLLDYGLVWNVDSTSKFYMYPRFLHLMIRKQVGDLSTHTTKYTSPALTQKVFANIRRVGKGFFGVETPVFEGMLVERHVVEEGDADENVDEVNAGDIAERDISAAHREVPNVIEKPSIPSLTPPTPPPQPSQDIPSTSQKVGIAHKVETSDETVMDDVSNQGRMIAEMDQDADIVLEDDKDVADDKEVADEDAKVDESVDIQGRQAESQAEIYKIDLDHANKVLSMQEDETEPAEVQELVDVVTTAKLITKVVTAASETITAASTILLLLKLKFLLLHLLLLLQELLLLLDEAIDHVKRKAKEDLAVKRYQVLKRKPQIEAQARKNMMIEEDENRALKRLNETPAKKAAKRKKLDKEVEELKRHLQIMPNEDDDVYTEATPLVRKEIFSTTKPKNFFDDFLLVTLGAMFEKPDIHAQIWKNQRSVHGPAKVKGWKLLESCGVQIITFITTQMILLVDRKYPLTRFTLDQMLNAVRLDVDEESEVSLELLRFTRQQHQEGQLE